LELIVEKVILRIFAAMNNKVSIYSDNGRGLKGEVEAKKKTSQTLEWEERSLRFWKSYGCAKFGRGRDFLIWQEQQRRKSLRVT
jgi:hypothetical protein